MAEPLIDTLIVPPPVCLIVSFLFPFILSFVVLSFTIEDEFLFVVTVVFVTFPPVPLPPFSSVVPLGREAHSLMVLLVVGHGTHPKLTR